MCRQTYISVTGKLRLSRQSCWDAKVQVHEYTIPCAHIGEGWRGEYLELLAWGQVVRMNCPHLEGTCLRDSTQGPECVCAVCVYCTFHVCDRLWYFMCVFSYLYLYVWCVCVCVHVCVCERKKALTIMLKQCKSISNNWKKVLCLRSSPTQFVCVITAVPVDANEVGGKLFSQVARLLNWFKEMSVIACMHRHQINIWKWFVNCWVYCIITV